ncbi:hypothetical protein IFM89_026283 [Coptis chinensis]|uniref:GDSL esterase/lipase n=1 Tax=Coptis chinensis TaxID=261450 RepID=A0A835MAN6_9MAGN|nr:hypothetical protein IFM89_026283 [Coptis chinensis]
MPNNKRIYVLSFLLLSTSFSIPYLTCNAHNGNCTYDAIYQFGDSFSDTGNFIREPARANTTFTRLPYGQTYFNKATGRASNGRLIIDFFAEALGLPLLNPYLQKNASFSHGVNFAVGGSTALNNSVLLQNGIISPVTNSSLSVQLD